MLDRRLGNLRPYKEVAALPATAIEDDDEEELEEEEETEEEEDEDVKR